MSSSCHGCAQTFGFLKREIGCPKCGFAFCKKCLKFEAVDPKIDKGTLICQRCHNLETAKMDFDEPPVITKALQRLESLGNPAKPPITLYRQPAREARMAQLKKGLSLEDQHIAERLESLRQPDPGNETGAPGQRRKSEKLEEEIADRLARLKGLPRCSEDSENKLVKPQVQTEDDLIARFSEEVKLDNNYQVDLVSDIEGRLAKLRGTTNKDMPASSTSQTENSFPEEEELSEDEQVRRILEKCKAEVDLEGRTSDSKQDVDPSVNSEEVKESLQDDISMSSASDDDEDLDNLCRICDEKRATLKCKECDGDLFCAKCFKELHLELGEVHKPTPFKK